MTNVISYFKNIIKGNVGFVKFVTKTDCKSQNTLLRKVYFLKTLVQLVTNVLFNDIYNNVFGPVAASLVGVAGLIKMLVGDHSVYNNPVHKDGTPWTLNQIRLALAECQAFVIHTAEGNIAVIHGSSDGRHIAYGEIKEKEDLFDLFETGSYILASCYNGNRSDISDDFHTFVRDEHTLTPYPCAMFIVGRKLYIGSDALFETAVKVSNTLYW